MTVAVLSCFPAGPRKGCDKQKQLFARLHNNNGTKQKKEETTVVGSYNCYISKTIQVDLTGHTHTHTHNTALENVSINVLVFPKQSSQCRAQTANSILTHWVQLTFSVTWQLLLHLVNGEPSHTTAGRPPLTTTHQTAVFLGSSWAIDPIPAVTFCSILQTCKLVPTGHKHIHTPLIIALVKNSLDGSIQADFTGLRNN